MADALAEDVGNIDLLGVTPLPLVLETRQHPAPDKVEKMAGMDLPYFTGEPRTTLGSFDLDTTFAVQHLTNHFKNTATPDSLLTNLAEKSLKSQGFQDVSAEVSLLSNQNQHCGCGCSSESCTCVAFIIHRGVLYAAFDGRTSVDNGEIVSDSSLKLMAIFPGFFLSYTGPTRTFERVYKAVVTRFKFREPNRRSDLTDFIKSLLDPKIDDIDFGMGGVMKGEMDLMKLSCTPGRVPPIEVTGLNKPLDHVYLGSGETGLKGLGPGPRKQTFKKMFDRMKSAMLRAMATDWHSGGYLTIVVVRMIWDEIEIERVLYEPVDFKKISRGYIKKKRVVSSAQKDDGAVFAPKYAEYQLTNQ